MFDNLNILQRTKTRAREIPPLGSIRPNLLRAAFPAAALLPAGLGRSPLWFPLFRLLSVSLLREGGCFRMAIVSCRRRARRDLQACLSAASIRQACTPSRSQLLDSELAHFTYKEVTVWRTCPGSRLGGHSQWLFCCECGCWVWCGPQAGWEARPSLLSPGLLGCRLVSQLCPLLAGAGSTPSCFICNPG